MVSYASGQFHYVWSVPLPSVEFELGDNKYYRPNDPKLTFLVKGDAKVFGAVKSLAQWQELTQNDRGSTISADMDLKRIMAQAERYLGMAAGGTS